MMILRKILGVAATTIALGLPAFGGEVTVFAAASLKTALDEVIAQEQLNAVAVYGGSAAMARQIAQGAWRQAFRLGEPLRLGSLA